MWARAQSNFCEPVSFRSMEFVWESNEWTIGVRVELIQPQAETKAIEDPVVSQPGVGIAVGLNPAGGWCDIDHLLDENSLFAR